MVAKAFRVRCSRFALLTGNAFGSAVIILLVTPRRAWRPWLGTPQILSFQRRQRFGAEPCLRRDALGKILGQRQCRLRVACGDQRESGLFSSGYGVGAELLEISQAASNRFAVQLVWKSIRMKAKFSHLYARDGSLYGLDDGILACVNLADGSQRWKEGRYGHGQGLLVGDLYLLMAESGELVLLRPTPDAPNELGGFAFLIPKPGIRRRFPGICCWSVMIRKPCVCG